MCILRLRKVEECGNKIGFKVRSKKMWQENRAYTEKQKKERENKGYPRSRRT